MNATDLLDLAYKGFAIVGGVGGLVAVVISWGMKSGFISRAEFQSWRDHHEEDHDELEDRLNRGDRHFVEFAEAMKHMPTKDDVHTLELALKDTNGEMRALSERLRGVGSQAALMTEGHLNFGDRG